MKKLRFVKALFAAASLALAIPGCSDLSTGSSTEQTAGKGVVTISADVASAARTALPLAGAIDLTTYTFTLTATAEGSTVAVTGLPTDVAYSVLSTAFTMAEGTYNFTLTATNATSDAKLAGTLSSVEISAATTATLAFTLYGVAADSATGSLVINVTYEDGYGATMVTPTLYSEGGTSLDSTYPLTYTADTETAGAGTITGTVPAGASYVGIVLSDGTETLGSVPKETVYAVKGVTSTSDVTIPVTQYKATVNVTGITEATTVTLKNKNVSGAADITLPAVSDSNTQYSAYVPLGTYNVYVGSETDIKATVSNATPQTARVGASISSISLSWSETDISATQPELYTGTTEDEILELLYVTVHYSDGTSAAPATAKSLGASLENYSSTSSAAQSVTVTYSGKSTPISITLLSAVYMTYVGTSSTTPSFTDDGVATGLSNGTYLVYPLNLLDSSVTTATITGTVKWTSASDKAGVGFISLPDGLYSGQEVNHYFIGGAGGIKGNGGSSWSSTPATGTAYTFTVSYGSTDSTNTNFMYSFKLVSGSTEITKDFKSNQIPWASTDYVYFAIGGSADNVTISTVSVTVGEESIGTANLVSTLPEDARTTLTASGTVSYELTATAYSTSNKGDLAVITLSNVSLSSLTLSPTAEGTWSWDAATVAYNGSTNPTATATFIPSDRTAYKAILSQDVTIEVTDSREEASQTTRNFTITYFDTSDSDLTTYAFAAAGTTTGGDYVTLTSAATAYNSIYDTLTPSWSSSTGATFALTNSANSYSAKSAGADLLTVTYTITAKDYDVTLKSIGFAGSQSATDNVHIDVRYNGTTVSSTDDAKSYTVAAQELNKTISAGSSATVSLVFALKSGSTLAKAISPILKDVVISCSVETGYSVGISFLNGDSDLTVSYDESTKTFTATAPDSTDSYTFAWYLDDVSQTATTTDGTVSTLTATAASLSAGNHILFVTATEASTGVVYSASYHVTVSE